MSAQIFGDLAVRWPRQFQQSAFEIASEAKVLDEIIRLMQILCCAIERVSATLTVEAGHGRYSGAFRYSERLRTFCRPASASNSSGS